MSQPLVTIITPIYNSGIYIIRSLECIKRQTFRDFEHIIIDDCSKDNSVEMVEKWIAENNHKCTFIKNATNQGVCKTLNTGIKLAKGKYIKGLADDEWDDTLLEKRIEHFEQQDENVGLTFSDTFLIDAQSNITANSTYEKRGQKISDILNALSYPKLLVFNKIITVSIMIRKSAFDKVGLYDENLIAEDYDMFYRLIKEYKFAYYPTPLVYWRRLPKGLSTNMGDRYYIDWLHVFTKHLSVLPQLKSRKLKYRKFAIYNYYNNKDVRTKWFLNSFKLNKDLISFSFLCICILKIKPESIIKIKSLIPKKG